MAERIRHLSRFFKNKGNDMKVLWLLCGLLSPVIVFAAVPAEATTALTDLIPDVAEIMAGIWGVCIGIVITLIMIELVRKGMSRAT